MKIILKSLLLVIIIAIPVYLTGRFDNKMPSNNINVVKLQNLHLFDSLDYLFVGNSYTYSGILPSYFDSLGYRSFNLGLSTAGLQFYELALENYLARVSNPPKYILLLYTPLTLSSKADNWEQYPIHRFLKPAVSNEAVAYRYSLGTEYLTMCRKSSTKGMSYIAKKVFGILPDAKDDFITTKGFYPKDGVYNDSIWTEMAPFYFSSKLESFNRDAFVDLMGLAESLEKRGSKIIFHDIPTFKLIDFFNEAYIREYYQGFEELEHRGFSVIRYSDSLDSTCFRNLDHLNYKGARLFSQELALKLNLN